MTICQSVLDEQKEEKDRRLSLDIVLFFFSRIRGEKEKSRIEREKKEKKETGKKRKQVGEERKKRGEREERKR